MMMLSNSNPDMQSDDSVHKINPAGVKSFSLGCSAAEPQVWNPTTPQNPARGDTPQRTNEVIIFDMPKQSQLSNTGNSVSSAKREFGSPFTTEPNPTGVKSFSLGCSEAKPQEWNPTTSKNPAKGDTTQRTNEVIIFDMPKQSQLSNTGNSVSSAKREFGSPFTTEPNPAGVESFSLGCSAAETQVWNPTSTQNPARGATPRSINACLI